MTIDVLAMRYAASISSVSAGDSPHIPIDGIYRQLGMSDFPTAIGVS
jgi:hypothetical protein